VTHAGYAERASQLFEKAAFVRDVGIELEEIAPGYCRASLALLPRHLQQNGFVHAGVQATLADHTAGAAGGSMVPPDKTVLSLEFKINLLRPANGERLLCEARVLRAGRTVSVTESEVFAVSGGARKLVAKATVTLAVVDIPA